MSFNVPDKRYFKIGEVSKLADVAPYVIRYWESEFEQITPKRAKSNQRLYRREDVLLILKIKRLLHGKGFTIAGARKLLESDQELEAAQAQPEKPLKRTSTTKRLEEIKIELKQLYQQLEQKK